MTARSLDNLPFAPELKHCGMRIGRVDSAYEPSHHRYVLVRKLDNGTESARNIIDTLPVAPWPKRDYRRFYKYVAP